jgi:hypothetical protein
MAHNPLIINPNKVYTEEELQKNSPTPLFEDYFMGENPDNVDIYIRYQNRKNNTQYIKLENKYIKLLPPYILAFDPKVLIDDDDNAIIDVELSGPFLKAMQLAHGLQEPPSRNEIVNILKKDTEEFYKKFRAKKAIQLLSL